MGDLNKSCLLSIGFKQEEIEKLEYCKKNNDLDGQLRILCSVRQGLLSDIHEKHKNLECLDYIINEVKKAITNE